MNKILSEIREYEITGVTAINKALISFWGTKFEVDDPMEPNPSLVFYYYSEEADEDKWAYSGVGHTTGIYGCVAYLPQIQWTYIMDDGQVYVVGKGFDGFEKNISKGVKYFTNVRSIKSGHAIAVGSNRKVFIREKKNSWKMLDKGLPEFSDSIAESFKDIDGFSESELYACGAKADLWKFQGGAWTKIDTGVNVDFTKICCSSDGFVYITTNTKQVLKGKDGVWEVINQKLTTKVFESIVDYKGRILISTEKDIYEIVNNKFILASLPGMPKMNLKTYLAVGEDVLVVAGKKEAVMYDGVQWTVILS